MSNTPGGWITDDDGAGLESAVTPGDVERRWRDQGGAGLRRCIVVTGMHRSGTGALAGALCAAGAWAGPEAELMPAVLASSGGEFERRSTTTALETQLARLGGSWSNPPLDRLQPWAQDQLRPTLRKVLSTATSDAPRNALPLVNDPRLCLFAAELRTMVLDDWPVVMAVRHPLEVARSLYDRDGLSIQAGLALWEIYNQSICVGFAGRPVHVVRYDTLVDDPGGTAGRLVDQVLVGHEAVSKSAQDRAEAHLARQVRDHRADVADEDRWLSVASLRLWHQLEAASQTPEASTLPAVELSYSAAQQVKLEASRQTLEGQVQELSERLAIQLRDTSEHEAVLRTQQDALRAEYESLQSTREGLELQLEQLRVANQSLADDVAAIEAELARAHQELSESQAGLAEAQAELALKEELTGRIDELTAANQELAQHVESLQDLRADALESLANSQRECDRFARANAVLEERYQDDVRRLLIEVDAARGEIASARASHTEAREGADAAIAAATALAESLWVQAEALQETSDELARVNHHRQELVEDINAICGSESWRVGHALTWPVRVFRRSGRREDRSTDTPS
jgi:hypothetical protein